MNTGYRLFRKRPTKFKPQMTVVGCFLSLKESGEILLLRRRSEKEDGGLYGLPAGKANLDETRTQAMRRELVEETKILASSMRKSHIVFARYPGKDFIFAMFEHTLSSNQNTGITLNEKEHDGYIWAQPQEALSLPLIPLLPECIDLWLERRK